MAVVEPNRRDANYWGLTVQSGPYPETSLDRARKFARFQPHIGNGLFKGGTKHGGHGNYETLMMPHSVQAGRPPVGMSYIAQNSIMEAPPNFERKRAPGTRRERKIQAMPYMPRKPNNKTTATQTDFQEGASGPGPSNALPGGGPAGGGPEGGDPSTPYPSPPSFDQGFQGGVGGLNETADTSLGPDDVISTPGYMSSVGGSVFGAATTVGRFVAQSIGTSGIAMDTLLRSLLGRMADPVISGLRFTQDMGTQGTRLISDKLAGPVTTYARDKILDYTFYSSDAGTDAIVNPFVDAISQMPSSSVNIPTATIQTIIQEMQNAPPGQQRGFIRQLTQFLSTGGMAAAGLVANAAPGRHATRQMLRNSAFRANLPGGGRQRYGA